MPKRHVENYDDDLAPPELIQQLDRFREQEERVAAELALIESTLEQNSTQLTRARQEAELAREERALYLTVLYELALRCGFKCLSPLESERHAATVFSQVPHLCAFDLDKRQLAGLTHVTCSIVAPRQGAEYYDPVSERNYPVSGNVVMCAFSGRLHRCVQGKFCSKTALAKEPTQEAVLESILHELRVQRLFMINELACAENWPVEDLTRVDEYANLLFGPVQATHICVLNTESPDPPTDDCPLFHLPYGWSYDDPFQPGRMLYSSGTIQLCRLSGHMRVNVLGTRLLYAKTFSVLRDRLAFYFQTCDSRSRDRGYICLLTNQFKSIIIDQTPLPEKDEKVSLRKLSVWKGAQKDREEQAESDDDGAGGDDGADLDEIEPDEVVIGESERLAQQLAEAKSGLLSTPKLSGKKLRKLSRKLDVEDELNETRDDEEEQAATTAAAEPAEAEPVVQLAPADAIAAEPPMVAPPKPSRKATSLVAEGEGADEINGMRAHYIAVLVTSNNSRFLLYNSLVKAAAAKAHEKLKQMQRQARFAALPVMELRRHWSIAFVRELPIAMPSNLEPIQLSEYVAVILRCWNRLVQTPFVVEDTVNKRTQATFAKTVISSLYCMADGGYEVNCSFGAEERKSLGLLLSQLPPHLALLEKRVKVYPNAKRLAPYLVDKAFLTQLSQLLGSKVRFNDGIIGRGREFLDSCYSSLILRKKQQVINEVRLCPTSREVAECILSYFKFCSSLQCWEQKQPLQQQPTPGALPDGPSPS